MELKINPAFHNLIPPISSEEYQLLEESILKEGCREKIVIWNDFILDGHNRYEICQKHDIKFGINEKCFDTEDEARFWIIRNQLARRNLPPAERIRLALLLKPVIEKKAKDKEHDRKTTLMKSTKSFDQPIHTRKQVAEAAGVSEDTVRKVEMIEKEGTEETKQATRKGKMSVNKAFIKTFGKRRKKKKKEFGKPQPDRQGRVLRELQKWWQDANAETRTKFFNWQRAHDDEKEILSGRGGDPE